MCHFSAKTNFFALTHFWVAQNKSSFQKKKKEERKRKTSWTRELTFSISDVSKQKVQYYRTALHFEKCLITLKVSRIECALNFCITILNVPMENVIQLKWRKILSEKSHKKPQRNEGREKLLLLAFYCSASLYSENWIRKTKQEAKNLSTN